VTVVADTTAAPRVRRRSIALPGWAVVFGAAALAFALLTALFGPFVAPYSPTELAGTPYLPPGGDFLLGTDTLGRDVLSRVLYGGRTVVLLAGAATLAAYAVGGTIGLVAGYSRSRADALLMRAVDVLLAFPPLLFLLVLGAGLGAGPVVLVVGIALINLPGIARVVRAATLDVAVRGFVEAALARGERPAAVLFREILPNIATTVAADAGVRFTGSILAVAGLNFLGLGVRPPAADWATMIAENRNTVTLQPWAVAAPALMIALLTLGVNIVADALARRGRGSTR
jgi:ABC-type dipeptide/oligopeptide/nickel transport system permease subunit